MDQVKTVSERDPAWVEMGSRTTSAAHRRITAVEVAAVVRTPQLVLQVASAEEVAAERTLAPRQDCLVLMEQAAAVAAPSGPAPQEALALSSFVGDLHLQHHRSR